MSDAHLMDITGRGLCTQMVRCEIQVQIHYICGPAQSTIWVILHQMQRMRERGGQREERFVLGQEHDIAPTHTHIIYVYIYTRQRSPT
jgi:hypothetical protein